MPKASTIDALLPGIPVPVINSISLKATGAKQNPGAMAVIVLFWKTNFIAPEGRYVNRS